MMLTVNGDVVEMTIGDAPPTIADLVEHLGLTKRLIVVELNGEPVRRAEHALVRLADGDCLELVRAVAGG